VKTDHYSEADFQKLLDYTNVVSDVFGSAPRNIYGLLTMSNYQGTLPTAP
jgi:hypothetical protein